MPELPKYPSKRMGVYKRQSEIPGYHRLETFSGFYQERNPWEEYLRVYLAPPCDSPSKEEQANRAFEKWNAVVTAEDRHYALCDPEDVETWAHTLLTDYTLSYAIANWSQINRFYDWLLTHPDHPHTYQPFLMAANESDQAAYSIWLQSIFAHWGSE